MRFMQSTWCRGAIADNFFRVTGVLKWQHFKNDEIPLLLCKKRRAKVEGPQSRGVVETSQTSLLISWRFLFALQSLHLHSSSFIMRVVAQRKLWLSLSLHSKLSLVFSDWGVIREIGESNCAASALRSKENTCRSRRKKGKVVKIDGGVSWDE